jgi:hypothetical protein
MPRGQEKEFLEMSRRLAGGIESVMAEWKTEMGAEPPAGWVVAFLMELAGQLVLKAPREVRTAVLIGAMGVFGEASGGVLVDADGNVPPPEKKH